MAVLLELAPRCWSDRAAGRWPVQGIDSPQPECCEWRQAEQLRPELRAFIVAQSTHLLQAVLLNLCGRARCVCEPLRVVAVLSCVIGTEVEGRAARSPAAALRSSGLNQAAFSSDRMWSIRKLRTLHRDTKQTHRECSPPLLLSFLFFCRIFHYLACFTRFKPL